MEKAAELAEKRRQLKHLNQQRDEHRKELEIARKTQTKTEAFILPLSLGDDTSSGVQNNGSLFDDETERVSGFGIVDRKVSALHFEAMVRKMQYVSLRDLSVFLANNEYDVPGDYVIIAIVSHKSGSRDSSKGSRYSFIELSDLLGNRIKLFLFNNAFERFHGVSRGSLIAILNAHAMKPIEGKSQFVALSVESDKRLLLLGTSKHFGICTAIADTESGKRCTNAVDLRRSTVCELHVIKRYRQRISNRPECSSSSYAAPDSELLQKNADGTIVKRVKVSMNGGMDPSNSTSSSVKASAFASLHSDPCVYKVGNQVVTTFAARKGSSGPVQMLSEEVIRKTHFSKDEDLLAATKPSALSDSAIRKIGFDPSGKRVDSFKRQISSLPQPRLGRDLSIGQDIDIIPSSSAVSNYLRSKKGSKGEEALSSQRKARILLDRKNISLDDDNNDGKSFDLAAAKREGIQYKKESNGNIFEAIKNKKVLEDDGMDIPLNTDGAKSYALNGRTGRKAKTSNHLASILGLTRQDLDKAAQQKSRFEGAAETELLRRRDAYFDEQERLEKHLAKLDSIREIKVTGYRCLDCKYLSQTVAKGCREMGHTPERIPNVTKRFFECCKCGYRREVLESLYPMGSCTKCSGSDFQPCSMLKKSRKQQDLKGKLVITDESVPGASSNRYHGL